MSDNPAHEELLRRLERIRRPTGAVTRLRRPMVVDPMPVCIDGTVAYRDLYSG